MAELHWSKEDKWLRWFYSGVLAVARDMGLIGAVEVNDVLTDENLLRVVSDFISETKSLAQFDQPKQAAAAFRTWATKVSKKVQPSKKQQIHAELEKNYGGAVVRFGWTGEFDVKNAVELRQAFEFAYQAVVQQFEWWSVSELPKLSASGVTAGKQEAHKVIISRAILKENKDGKDYYRIRGGEFEKYGVYLWPEVAAKAGVDLASLAYGENAFSRECVILMDGDKPEKVLEIL